MLQDQAFQHTLCEQLVLFVKLANGFELQPQPLIRSPGFLAKYQVIQAHMQRLDQTDQKGLKGSGHLFYNTFHFPPSLYLVRLNGQVFPFESTVF